MIDDLIKQQAQLQRQVDGIVVPELSPDLISPFLSIPGLVGFWPMSSVQRSTGNAYDVSGQGRTLAYNGNPTYNYLANGTPYIDLDGTGDYLSRADETDLDVLGTETIYATAVRGLAFGGWFLFNALPAAARPMGKDDLGANRSYGIFTTAAAVEGIINGTTSVISTVVPVTGAWYFIVIRLIPSTELAIFANSTKTINIAAIPASINNSAAAFTIGASGAATQLMTGRASLCFLSANALSDGKISSIFQQTRGAFGV